MGVVLDHTMIPADEALTLCRSPVDVLGLGAPRTS